MASKKKTVKELSEIIPSKIEGHGHHGNLTIMKRSNNKFLAYYPFEAKRTVPTTKGKTIQACLQRMHDELVNRDIIIEEVKKKSKKKLKLKKVGPLAPKERMRRKLNIQKKTLKSKW